MKEITGWEWNNEESVYVQEGFVWGKLDKELGTNKQGDVIGKSIYDPNSARWYNSFEQAQSIRFAVALHWMKSRLSEMLNVEGKKRKKLILDLGCSRSFIYRRWKNNMNFFNWPTLHYWGVDSSLKRINDGRNSFVKKKNDSVIYFLADLSSNIKFPAKADILICLEVLEHIPKSKVHTLLNNIYNALNSTGIAIISSPNPKEKGGWVWAESQKSHHYEYIWEEAEKLLISHGFEILDVTGVLPDRNYFRESSFLPIRKRLAELLPASMINNILLLAEEDMSKKRQWITKLQKK